MGEGSDTLWEHHWVISLWLVGFAMAGRMRGEPFRTRYLFIFAESCYDVCYFVVVFSCKSKTEIQVLVLLLTQ